jgi:hypothetical protein
VLQTLLPCRASLSCVHPHTAPAAHSLALSLACSCGGTGLDGVVRKRKGVKKGKPAAKRGRGGRMGGIVLEDDDDDDGAKDGVCACMHA